MKKEIASAVAVALMFSGCMTPTAPEPVLLNAHVRIVAPGDTVPPLPDGESKWWLLTPRGFRFVTPGAFDFPR